MSAATVLPERVRSSEWGTGSDRWRFVVDTGSFDEIERTIRTTTGDERTTARENLRRLAAHAQACHPALVIDPASEAFVRRGAEPPQLGSPRLVAEYDAAYG